MGFEKYSDDWELLQLLSGKIREVEKAISPDEISGLVPIRQRRVYYRFKITSRKTLYRIGIKILHNKVWFVIIDTYKKRFYERI